MLSPPTRHTPLGAVQGTSLLWALVLLCKRWLSSSSADLEGLLWSHPSPGAQLTPTPGLARVGFSSRRHPLSCRGGTLHPARALGTGWQEGGWSTLLPPLPQPCSRLSPTGPEEGSPRGQGCSQGWGGAAWAGRLCSVSRVPVQQPRGAPPRATQDNWPATCFRPLSLL